VFCQIKNAGVQHLAALNARRIMLEMSGIKRGGGAALLEGKNNIQKRRGR
jgi:hypothetical protein